MNLGSPGYLGAIKSKRSDRVELNTKFSQSLTQRNKYTQISKYICNSVPILIHITYYIQCNIVI